MAWVLPIEVETFSAELMNGRYSQDVVVDFSYFLYLCKVENRPKSPPSDRLMVRLQEAFLDYGYEPVTMVTLAKACGVTRRTLYNYFTDKAEAFRSVLRYRHALDIEAGLQAGARMIAEGGSALDAIVAIMDARYGEARRSLERSPHAVEINYSAFRHFRDVMAASAVAFQARLGAFLAELDKAGKLRLRPGLSPEHVAGLLADGARGVNQGLPPQPALSLAERYRPMFAAILFGCSESLEAEDK